MARGLLRTSRLLEEAATQPGDPDWIPNLREVGAAQERRDLIAVLRATNGNISRAADVLHTSQPGISKQIGLLEEELNTSVFVRFQNGFRTLTGAS